MENKIMRKFITNENGNVIFSVSILYQVHAIIINMECITEHSGAIGAISLCMSFKLVLMHVNLYIV
jgi:hypothetical protein